MDIGSVRLKRSKPLRQFVPKAMLSFLKTLSVARCELR
jgi:hypothetical protein